MQGAKRRPLRLHVIIGSKTPSRELLKGSEEEIELPPAAK
jgi:hypothetical protein